MKIGFIGLGAMGGALAQVVAQQADTHLLFSNHNPQKAAALQARLGGELLSNWEVIEQADVIFLGVKPSVVEMLLADYRTLLGQDSEQVWISMAAGVSLSQLSQYIPVNRLVRIMPNTPVAIGQGMTTYCVGDPSLSPLVRNLLLYSGEVQELPEHLMNAATALAGCGPAFVYQMIEALTDAGIQQGLSAKTAQFLAAQTLLGTSQLLLQSDKHPAQLRQEVMSPGGATAAGVAALEKARFRYALIKAVSAALKRTQQLLKNW